MALAAGSARTFNRWYDPARITDWATRLASLIEAVQRALAMGTDAYLARLSSQVTGKRVRPAGRVDVSSLRAGVSHAGAYGRAADVYRWQQHQFDTYTRNFLTVPDPLPPDLITPLEAAVNRVEAVADMDAQLAVRAQSQRSLTDQAERGVITGYRRVIHPELSKGGSCGLCVAASDRIYGATEPLPIHDRCECTTVPVYDHADPGSVLNAADLDRLYREAGGTAGAELKRTRYRVDEHGELGPVLSAAGTPFRGPRQVKRDTSTIRPAKSPEWKAADLQRVLTGQRAALPKAQDLAGTDPARWGKYLADLETRVRDLEKQLAA